MIKTKTQIAFPWALTNPLTTQTTVKTANTFLLMVVAGLCFAYLIVVNNLAVQGFEIRDYQQQLTDLQQQNEAFQLAIQDIQSLPSTTTKVESLGMIAAGDIQYLSAAQSEVSLAK